MQALIAFACLLPAVLSASGCGGTYKGFQHTLTSPSYPRDYPDNSHCVYALEGDASGECEQQFHLQFLDFDVRGSENCREDYLQVGDGHVFCGSVLGLRRFVGKNNTLKLLFHSDGRHTSKGFKIIVSAVPCSLGLNPLKDGDFAKRRGSSAHDPYRRGVGQSEGAADSATTPSPESFRLNAARQQSPDQESEAPLSPDVRLASYLFLPPSDSNATTFNLIGDRVYEAVTPPPAELLPPSDRPAVDFSEFPRSVQAALDKSSTLSNRAQRVSYGEPGQAYDLPVAGDCDKSGARGSDRVNYDPVGGGFSSGFVYDPRYGGVGGSYPGGHNPELGVAPNHPSGAGWGLPTYPSEGFVPSYNPSYGNYHPGYAQGGECCRIPAARRFTIASPGFPGSLATSNYACRYTIAKHTPDVCRLRLVFRFFNFGAEEQYCSYGYVEIDGRRYCGCKTGQSVQLPFTSYIAKTIFVAYAALPRSKFSGFLIDVIQEPCGGIDQLNPSSGLGYQNYFQRRADASSDTLGEDATSVVPSRVRSRRNVGYSYSKPGVAFVVNGGFPGIRNERFFGASCESRLFLDWALASKEAILTNQRCSAVPSAYDSRRRAYLPPSNRAGAMGPGCEEISVNQGFLKSPLYPSRYPSNVHKCYRFNKAPNACRLQLHVQDFDLEPSQGCAKDYLLFSGEDRRYCGRALSNYKNAFDLARVNFVEVYFSTDSEGTGRGFNIGFSQLPCEASANF